jgi:hypothetical protein
MFFVKLTNPSNRPFFTKLFDFAPKIFMFLGSSNNNLTFRVDFFVVSSKILHTLASMLENYCRVLYYVDDIII